ncbi:MAG TPA: transcription termination/antitermination protein NusG [Ignavibacteriales bacterium]|nr:transcription termination/antitermination protein NusG [Ignavibacteriales bacterium]HOL81955.1 transcription termination/antitermination protein NusG [Ignavibacteriales bacterium]HOM65001.1 transcription termination/antitermination protein NusG [Ignavibacteriales bacterium]HPD67267.1 transcription termination/antitermination protein NusG [Ignavibacteriales bacterium]HPP34092.1 transcription termination/antitermination protein NusG [Ignavibacteriales bacterium]
MEELLNYKWYAVRTFASHENKVKNYIEAELKRNEALALKIQRVVIPVEKVYEVKDGKKRVKNKRIMPGYIIIQADLDAQVKDFVLNTPSVMGFLGVNKYTPVPLMPDEVKRLLAKVDDSVQSEKVESMFKVGDVVTIISGPFQNFNGTVQEVNDEKMKMKVMVSIFGRKTPVEIEYTQAELAK